MYNTEVVEEHSRVINQSQIFVVSYNGENNLLMEADTPEECSEWVAAIKTHIAYYNNLSSLRI